MSSSAAKTHQGSFVGTGAELDVRKVGFRPRSVRLYNRDGLASAVFIDGMADGTGLKTITAGTMSAMTVGITPLSDGFRLGADTDLNVAGETVFYECTD
jgi:hypothetical protein